MRVRSPTIEGETRILVCPFRRPCRNRIGARKRVRASQALGSIDTFRFEERALLKWCAELIQNRKYAEAPPVDRWQIGMLLGCEQDYVRQVQWQCCRLTAELGLACATAAEQWRVFKSPARTLGRG